MFGPIPLEAFADEPVVLAFVPGSTRAPPDGALEPLRAELRGLGAALVLIASDAVFCFRADDARAKRATPEQISAEDVAALRARCGAPADGLSLFVIDDKRAIRFARIAPLAPERDAIAVLIAALAEAGRHAVATFAPARAPASSDAAPGIRMSRREVVLTALASAFALTLAEACRPRGTVTTQEATGHPVPSDAGATVNEVDVTLRINGTDRALRIEPRVSLLDALRERLALPGTKKGCDHGQCGACTVLVAGRRVNACLTLAVMVQGSDITTIEGLARGDVLHPMQAEFASQDALQCGYCTPGQIMSAVGLVAEGRAHSDDEVREEMSGNICRCGAYPNIVSAVQLARKQMAT